MLAKKISRYQSEAWSDIKPPRPGMGVASCQSGIRWVRSTNGGADRLSEASVDLERKAEGKER